MLDRRVFIAAALLLTLIFAACSDDDTTAPPGGVVQTVDSLTFSPPGGNYASVQTVNIGCPTADADIYYTLDGSDPAESSTLYDPLSGGITIAATATVKAKAYKDGMNPSAIATADYTIDLPDVAEPQISPQGGIYAADQLVTITCATAGAEIRYTTDGTEPNQRSPLYSRSFTVSSTTTVRARAFAADMDPSPIAEETLVIIGGLVAYYPFSGNANDASGNGRDGVPYGVLMATDRHGVGRSAYQFDGVDDYIELTDEASFDFTEYTISVWVRVDTLPIVPGPMQPGRYTTINKGSNLGNYTLDVAKYGGASYCNLSYSHRTATGNWAMGCTAENLYRFNWYQVIITMDTEINFYVNGVLACTSTGMTAPVVNDDNVLIGKLRSASDERPFKGFIDDVRFYNRALSAAEIQQLYNAEH